MHPDRVVIGADPGDEEAADAVAALYEPLGGEILRTDVASAEMIKLASNAFLATKISFINEIANVCEEVGADVGEVARGMGLDERIGSSFLRAGIGYGGSCFPKDVSALKMLAGNTGYHFQLLNAVIEVNELQKRRVVGKLEKHLGSLLGKRVALLGLAFKPDTDDMREASSLVLAARLQGEGAEVVAYDPVASERAARAARLGRDGRLGAGGARRRRRRGPGHRVARVRRARLGRGGGADGAPADRRRPQLPRPADAGRGRLRVRGHRQAHRQRRPPAAGCRRSDAGDRPRRRRGDAAAAADRRRPEAGADPGRPALPRLHGRVAGGATGSTRWCSPAASCPTCCARRSARASTTGSGSPTWPSPSRAAPPARSASPPTPSASASTTASSRSTATSSPTST